MPLRRSRGEPVEPPERAGIPPIENSNVVGLGVEEVAGLPVPIPEPLDRVANLPGPLPEPAEVGTLPVSLPEPAAEVADLPLPLPEPAAVVGMDPNPVILPSGPLEAEGVELSYVEDSTPPPPPPRSENPDDPFHDEDVLA